MSIRRDHPLACRLPKVDGETFKRIARQRGMSVSGLIKIAIEPYLREVNQELTEPFDFATVSRPRSAPRIRDDAPLDRAGRFSEKMR
jgi:hypothetical protein